MVRSQRIQEAGRDGGVLLFQFLQPRSGDKNPEKWPAQNVEPEIRAPSVPLEFGFAVEKVRSPNRIVEVLPVHVLSRDAAADLHPLRQSEGIARGGLPVCGFQSPGRVFSPKVAVPDEAKVCQGTFENADADLSLIHI